MSNLLNGSMQPSSKLGIVGHSHIDALSDAMRKDAATQALFSGLQVEFVSLRDERFDPASRRPGALNGRLRHGLSGFGQCDVVVLAVAGNAHNVLGLINFTPRFDFVLPSAPDLPIDEGAELLPAALIKQEMARRTERHLDMVRRLRRVCPARMYHMESPPPIPSADHVARYPGIFKDTIAERGVAPAYLRYKLWRVYSEAIKAGCDSIRIEFVPAPRETQDADGMMREEFWNPDPTHGNHLYGACVMRQIRAIYDRTAIHAHQEPEAASL